MPEQAILLPIRRNQGVFSSIGEVVLLVFCERCSAMSMIDVHLGVLKGSFALSRD
jgi:hypothetical protein